MLSACDHISEDERLIYEKPEPAQRVVLLEDFTGQKCTNCPSATDIIEQLQETYGDALVAVGIHGGPLGFAGNAKVVGLATDLGNEYYNHWNLEYQPVGLVDRLAPSNYTEWAAIVKEELAKPAPLHLFGFATIEDNTIRITIDVEAKGNVVGKLQVWVLEDGIETLQMMPDGSANQQYIHNHVLRAAVNGAWGEDFSINEGEIGQQMMSIDLQPDWNPEQLSIVTFVYNDSGVQQAAKFAIENED